MSKLGSIGRSGTVRKLNETMRIFITAIIGVAFGFFIGLSFPTISLTRFNLPSSLIPSIDLAYVQDRNSVLSTENFWNYDWFSAKNQNKSVMKEDQNLTDTPRGLTNEDRNMTDNRNITDNRNSTDKSKIWAPTNPRGAERLPPGIIASESDFYLRRLWGKPSEDLKVKPKYLVTFTVGYNQKSNIDAAVKKFSDNFTILLFHYDGRTSEWDKFDWSKRAIHISVRKQTKWWYAKRFLHPDIVAPYDYIFIWDEDLGVEHFDAEEYIKLVRKHGLDISQPGLEPNKGLTWQMTKRRGHLEVHKNTKEKPGWCLYPDLPPCAAFVEIMAPVFSRDAWRCVWHMLQNDLVHGWGLDFALRRCVEPAHEKIGVVDAQWVVHQSVPSLGNQGESVGGKAPWQGVRERCKSEWQMFQSRMANAEKRYYEELGMHQRNSTGRQQ